MNLFIILGTLLIGSAPTSHSKPIIPSDLLLQFFDFDLSSTATENLNISLLLVNGTNTATEFIQLPLPENTAPPNLQIDFQKEFVFIIHGYMSSGRVRWMTDLASAYMEKKDVNVIVVDWGLGAIAYNYMTAVENAKVTANLLSDFINYLITVQGVNSTSIHMIGHSLGAHVAGFVGKNVTNLGRITGLDPAKPLFGDANNRLKQGDAINVDIIHTNGFFLGCGISESIGDVDFFLNGGRLQPGCPFHLMDYTYYFKLLKLNGFRIDAFYMEVLLRLGCSHLRAIEYFVESIRNTNCSFTGYRYIGEKQNISEDDISVMGLSTFEYSGRGDFFIDTNSQSPYCKNE